MVVRTGVVLGVVVSCFVVVGGDVVVGRGGVVVTAFVVVITGTGQSSFSIISSMSCCNFEFLLHHSFSGFGSEHIKLVIVSRFEIQAFCVAGPGITSV